MHSESSKLEIWDRLRREGSLDGLALPIHDGRIDLRGLELPEPSVVRRYQTATAEVAEIEPSATFRQTKFQSLDLTGSRLNGLRLFGCEIDNCRFDNSQLQDLRLWSAKVTATSFRGASLRTAALGGVEEGRRNVFSGVDFAAADLRETAYKAAAFERCVFRNTNLEKVDFQTSTFSECQFEGELHHVLFYRRGFKGEPFPPNEMINVDFSRARLRYVEFRGLTLDRVRLPDDAEHIVIRNYPAVLDELIAVFRQQSDVPSKKLAAYLGVHRKWAPADQVQGVLNMQDVADIAGAQAANRVRELLGR